MSLSDRLSGRKEKTARHTGAKHTYKEDSGEQMLLNQLLDIGFHWDEAVKLLTLREHLCENAEMHQRMSDDYRRHFVKWLYEHGIVSEELLE
jgi:hypothetical protein